MSIPKVPLLSEEERTPIVTTLLEIYNGLGFLDQ